MYIDITVLTILFLFTFFGYKKGIIAEFISFGALILNIVLSGRFSPIISNRVNIESNFIVNILSYLITFITIYIALNLFISFILKTLKRNTNMLLDSVIGSFFGFLKGSVIILILLGIFFVWGSFDPKVGAELDQSISYKMSLKVIDTTKILLPKDIKKMLDEFREKKELEKILEEFLSKEIR